MNLDNKYQAQRFFHSLSWFKMILLSVLPWFFIACASTVNFNAMTANKVEYDDEKSAAYYFQLMQHSVDTVKADLHLMAIRALVKEQRFTEAKQHLADLPLFLSDIQKNEKALIVADLATRQQIKKNLNIIDIEALTPSQRIYFYNIKLRQDKQVKDVNVIARDYILLEKMAATKSKRKIIEETWQFFKSLSNEQLNSIIAFPNEMTLQGWVDLIFSYHHSFGSEQSLLVPEQNKNRLDNASLQLTDGDDIKQLISLVSEWKIQYPSHPAAIFVPRELGYLRGDSVDDISKTVALLLPLKGAFKAFGDAVKAGYMDAPSFYPDEKSQRVILLDTTRRSITSLIDEAGKQGAELIVGPLLKQEVLELTKQSSALPVLALNKPISDLSSSSPAKICYFSLSPEDEAVSAARHIFKKGKRKPLIITASNALGKRIVAAFNRQWHAFNQHEVSVQYFASVDSLKEAMNRGRGLLVGGKVIDASGHHSSDSDQTSDIDAIYIFSTQEELSFIKPMLDMPYSVNSNQQIRTKVQSNKLISSNNRQASLPPIYVSSHGKLTSDSIDYRYEMENVQFSEMPLLVTKNPVYPALPSAIKADYTLARLYAMGIDAWRLANRFEHLITGKKIRLKGLTGSMTISPRCEIDRELLWGIYRKGRVIII